RLPLVDRYVMRHVLAPLAVAMTIGLLVLLSERLVRLLDVTMGKKNSIGVIFELLGYLVPHYLGLAIPAALFLGMLFGFNRMSKDSEVDAFLAGGVGMHRLARPVIMLSLVLAILSLFIFGWLQSHTRYAYRAVLHTVKNVEVFYLAEEGVFMQADTRTFILDKLDRGSSAFERIFLFDYRGPNGSQTVTAVGGSLIEQDGDPRPILRLKNGHRLKLDGWPNLGTDVELPKSTSGTFERIDTPLGKISRTIFRPRGIDAREMTLPELWTRLRNEPGAKNISAVRAEFHKRLVSSATIFMLPFLALPFALGTRRGQRAYRFAVALIILVAYHEIIEQGAVATKNKDVSVLVTAWLPFICLSVFALWRFITVCFMLRKDRMEPIYERMADIIGRCWGLVTRQLGAQT
ncbi:MAG: LptF/LptG family permease, partial [Aestuariivirgaceae bacterium]